MESTKPIPTIQSTFRSNVIRFPLARVFRRSTGESFARALDMYAAQTERELKELEERIEARKRQDEINALEWKRMEFKELDDVPVT